MSGRMKRCPTDGTYTLHEICPVCGNQARTAHPPRYSPADRYGEYRRIAKQWMISR